MKTFNKLKPIYIILALFFIGNLFLLNHFPFVHSDEAWLSGLSRHILKSKSLEVTEPFFDIYPRNPHALKVFFHMIQIIFLKIFGYSIFSFRLLSLTAGTLCLFFFFKIAQLISRSKFLIYSLVILMGIDIHFIYSSHLARQEIILVLIFLTAAYYHLRHYQSGKNKNIPIDKKEDNFKQDAVLALILGFSIGIHPNSFVISLPFILIYTYNLFFSSKITWKNYLTFGSILALSAAFFVGLSLKINPSFFSDYAAYGKKLGVLSPFLTKIDRWDYFYKKIFHQVSGTYYIPPVQIQLIIFGAVFLFSLIKQYFQRNNKVFFLILSLVGINLGYIIIGRYNQTGIIFIFPVFYLLLLNLLSSIKWKYAGYLVLILLLVLSFNTTRALIEDSSFKYDNYLQQLDKAVEPEDKVLANLNCQYFFEINQLRDYRNLAYLSENDLTFKEYIQKNEIEYIIYPEEMNFIYQTRPVWNILYGNLYPYYQEMQTFFENNCKLIYEFQNPYGMRIVRYMDQKNWKIKIYKVKDDILSK